MAEDLMQSFGADSTLSRRPVRVIGIDLGTTNSTVAQISWPPTKPQELRPRCIEVAQRTPLGEYTNVLVPSVVAIRSGEALVGEGAKRLRGMLAEYGLEQYRDIFWETKNHIGSRRTYPKAPGGFRSPVDIGSHILRFLRDAAAEEPGENLARTVVTVPASFRAAQRADTIQAAINAGIDLQPGDLLDEPIAAFLESISQTGASSLGDPGDDKLLLVFDFGGGTCDVAIFRMTLPERNEPLRVATRAVSRYHRLGGGDIDDAISFDHLLPQLAEQNGLSVDDLTFTEKSRWIGPALRRISESLKILLCDEVRRVRALGRPVDPTYARRLPGAHTVMLPADQQMRITNPTLPLEVFERLLTPFLDHDVLYVRESDYHQSCSIFAPITDALDRAGLNSDDIDFVLMAGGSSRIPQVEDAVVDFFERATMLRFNSDEDQVTAIAKGAAWQALSLTIRQRPLITSTSADAILLKTSSGLLPLVPMGATLPYPAEGWRQNTELAMPEGSLVSPVKVRIELVDGEERPLGAWAWEIDPPSRKGEPLELRFRLDENQKLFAELRRPDDDNPFTVALENPLTNVAGTDEKRQEVEALEEQMRRGAMSAEEKEQTSDRIAHLYRDLGMREKAMDLLARMLRDRPRDAEILNLMGLTAGDMGNHSREIKLLREAADASAWTGPLFNLALAHRRHNEIQKAIDALDEALSREREAPFLVLLAQLKKEHAAPLVREAFEIFDTPERLSDWQLHWYREAATLVNDASRKAKADAERERRRRTGATVPDGTPPDRRAGLVRR